MKLRNLGPNKKFSGACSPGLGVWRGRILLTSVVTQVTSINNSSLSGNAPHQSEHRTLSLDQSERSLLGVSGGRPARISQILNVNTPLSIVELFVKKLGFFTFHTLHFTHMTVV